MMTIQKLFKTLLVLFGALWLTACSTLNSNQARVTYRNFDEEIDLKQNLTFMFDREVAEPVYIGDWLDDELIKFEPAVVGKFRWKSGKELEFSPEQGFMPSTDYKAEFTEAFFKQAAGTKIEKESSRFAFHTPYLTLQNTDIFWTMGQQGEPEVRMNLNFNYKVSPQELDKLLKVKTSDKEAPYKLNTTADGQTIQIALVGSGKMEKQPLKVEIAKGLGTTESAYKADDILFESEVPSREKFKVLRAESEYHQGQYIVHIHTNQGVGVEEVKPFVKVVPKLPFEIEKLDYGFLVKGNFEMGKEYKLVVDKGLKGVFQDKLGTDFTQDVMFGNVDPSIGFGDSKAIYLNKKGVRQVGVKIVNVKEIEVAVHKIYKNNLLAYLRDNGHLGSYYDENYYYTDFGKYGDEIFNETIETKALKEAEGQYLIDLNIPDSKPFEGVYVLTVRSTDQRYLKARKLVAVSDIGLIAKRGGNSITVFANSVMTTEPLADVEVTLVSTNNQEVYTLKTNASGVAQFKDLKSTVPGFDVNMLLAKKGNDFNYMHFRQTEVEKYRYEVGGMRSNVTGLMAYLYGDRNLYRPGETIHLKTVVRDSQWKAVQDLPIKLKVLMPDGNEFVSEKAELNKQGTYETDVKLPASTITGTYSVELHTANDVLLSSYKVSVEEFMPDRIKVNVNTDKESLKTEEALVLKAQALNLFGPPAAGRNYEVEMQLSKQYFSPKDLREYDFSLKGMDNLRFEKEYREGQTDNEGNLEEQFAIAKNFKNKGLLEGKIYTTVFDETGRPVNRITRFEVVTQDVFVGIKNTDRYIKARSQMQVPLVAVNHTGKVYKSAKARLKLIKYDWQSVLERNNYGRYRYVSNKKERVIADKQISLNGSGSSYSFVPQESGEYELRVYAEGSDTYVSREFYAYGWGSTTNSSFEVDKEGRISMELDKENYEIGETANVLFKAPFSGKLLVTVEREEVLDHFVIDTEKKSATLQLPIKESYLPNAYISATLIKPLTDDAIPLTVAHGIEPINVKNSEKQIQLTVEAPEKSRSRKQQEITIKSSLEESDIEVTVAVVDEGVLQIKNYQSPDPFSYFFQKRALEVNSYDLYPKLFPELKPQAARFGAGAFADEMGKRVNPLSNKRVKLVSFWSGTLKTDSDGEVTYKIDVPEFSGSLRVMAVAVKGDAFGAGSAHITVADPLVVSTALPRFMSPSDKVKMPVTLTNTTDKAMKVDASFELEGALKNEGDSKESVTIPANSEKLINFELSAAKAIGTGKVKVIAKTNGENFISETDLTVRPSTSLLKASGAGVVDAGKTAKVDLKRDYLDTSIKGKLLVSKSPVVQFADNLDYLLRYPYGCVEQTVSAVFPQLYFADLSNVLGQGSESTKANADYNIKEAINKLKTMQLYSGGLSYWQGGSYESWWGSVYAAHFLQEASKAGYHVDKKLLDKLYAYLKGRLKQKRTHKYYYYVSGSRYEREVASREVFYSMYVLANMGYHDLATMNYYKAKPELLTTDSKYLLASTYLLSGDMKSYRTVLPAAFGKEKTEKEFGGSFASFIRDRALVLNVMLEADPNNAQIGSLARELTQEMKNSKYLSTQESAFGMLALGKFTRKNESSNVTGVVSADGKKVDSFNGNDLVAKEGVLGKQVEIKAEGAGKLYYFWEMEGLSTTGEFKEGDSQLKVRRSFLDRNGNQISADAFNQNDLIVVKITLETDGRNVENVVVTDMLPAGFEVENPRISQVPGMEWAKGSAPEHSDFRDDRVNFFTTATSKPKDYYYVVRAVSKGEFRMGPVSADAMYNGEYHSYHGAGKVTVQ
ncbi:MG2 domain-containing protein [Limibacter armeniacum]|uniref:alpha-2-macroglobulin family protein n=1 Tax=Limibacter armeniacum TaxID=466084 RepID=UPI002FE54F18